MYNDNSWSGHKSLRRPWDCIVARHQRGFGGFGLPQDRSATVMHVSLPGHLEPLGKQGQPMTPIDEIQGCGTFERLNELVKQGHPVILRDCLHGHFSPGASELTPAMLKQLAGNHTSRWCTQRLGDYVDNGMPFYRNCDGLPPELLAQIDAPHPLQPGGIGKYYDKTVMWTYGAMQAGVQSTPYHSSALHFDPNENFMHQLAGQKHLLLVDPVESVLLYSDFAAKATGNTPVDPHSVNTVQYPLTAQLTLHKAVLRRGDIAYIPSGWWHLITTDLTPQVGWNCAMTVQARCVPPCQIWLISSPGSCMPTFASTTALAHVLAYTASLVTLTVVAPT